MSDLVDRRLGQYELREVIQRGGMSTVYKAYQPSLQRWVAVKVLAHPGDPEFISRFQLEARSIAQLQHPNVVSIYDYGEQDGQLYLVMQYVEDGRTLADLTGEPMAPVRALPLVALLLAGLGYAHRRGIVHRDIKPSNVLLPSPAWPVLSDFGIVRLLLDDQAPRLTREGLIIGTAAYMAPEQAHGLPVDARTDLYATGAVLYELITGRVPFDATTPVAALMQHAYEPPPPPRELTPDLPVEVEAMLLHALAKAPEDRYQTAEEMTEAIQEALASLQRIPSVGPPEPQAAAYAAGVRAFAEGRFDEVVARLSPLADTDPGYEDVDELLEAARASLDAQPRIAATEGASRQPLAAAHPDEPSAAGDSIPAGPSPEWGGVADPATGSTPLPGPARPPPRRAAGRIRRPASPGRERRWPTVLAGITLTVLLVAAGVAISARRASSGEVFLEPSTSAGALPFTPSAAAPPVVSPATTTRPPAPTSPTSASTMARAAVRVVRGTVPGLYGGTRNRSSCNARLLVKFLQAHPDRAAAWAGVAGVKAADIPRFVATLTPVLLRFDTRVTNHGFRDGRAIPRQSVLQAGTAVLVDTSGAPRTRCACGNPLLEPQAVQTAPAYTGSRWAGFVPSAVAAVAPGPPMRAVVLVDPLTGAGIRRPVGTAGSGDSNTRLSTGAPGAPTTPSPIGTTTSLGSPTTDLPVPTIGSTTQTTTTGTTQTSTSTTGSTGTTHTTTSTTGATESTTGTTETTSPTQTTGTPASGATGTTAATKTTGAASSGTTGRP